VKDDVRHLRQQIKLSPHIITTTITSSKHQTTAKPITNTPQYNTGKTVNRTE